MVHYWMAGDSVANTTQLANISTVTKLMSAFRSMQGKGITCKEKQRSNLDD